MSTHTESARKRIRETVAHWRSAAHWSHGVGHPDYVQDLQRDGLITSPKVYESGVITNLDLRLVDLYDGCATESDPPPPVPIEHGIAC